MKISVLASLFLIFVGSEISAQIVITNPGRVAERAVENRANQKVYQGVDKGFDKIEEEIGNLFKKKKKEEKPANNQQKPIEPSDNETDNNQSDGNVSSKGKKASLQTYSKFDFISGEKVIVQEDFSQDEVGDFPAKWNTNSTGELVTVEGTKGKWLSLSKAGTFMPEFITTLPENFTLEFDILVNNEFSFYSSEFKVAMASLSNPKDFTKWQRFKHDDITGTDISFHPMDAGSGHGRTEFDVYNKANKPEMHNEINTSQFFAKQNNFAHVSIWRQKQRLRVYLNEEKVWDLPRAMDLAVNYNSLIFYLQDFHKAEDRYLMSNLRLAVGAPDTRNKLITEGKFVTTGITFDVNSATIKPESYGTLKTIAQVLQDNADVRVKIIGHTDSDGEDNANMSLSKKRSEAVKAILSSDFGINASRLESDGKGESQPVGDNKTPEGKANNRRVEFVKL
jgi:OmpA-OmpF porin, OOP family